MNGKDTTTKLPLPLAEITIEDMQHRRRSDVDPQCSRYHRSHCARHNQKLPLRHYVHHCPPASRTNKQTDPSLLRSSDRFGLDIRHRPSCPLCSKTEPELNTRGRRRRGQRRNWATVVQNSDTDRHRFYFSRFISSILPFSSRRTEDSSKRPAF